MTYRYQEGDRVVVAVEENRIRTPVGRTGTVLEEQPALEGSGYVEVQLDGDERSTSIQDAHLALLPPREGA